MVKRWNFKSVVAGSIPVLLAIFLLTGCDYTFEQNAKELEEDKYLKERVLVKSCMNGYFIFSWNGRYFLERGLYDFQARPVSVASPDICQ